MFASTSTSALLFYSIELVQAFVYELSEFPHHVVKIIPSRVFSRVIAHVSRHRTDALRDVRRRRERLTNVLSRRVIPGDVADVVRHGLRARTETLDSSSSSSRGESRAVASVDGGRASSCACICICISLDDDDDDGWATSSSVISARARVRARNASATNAGGANGTRSRDMTLAREEMNAMK